LLCSLAILAGLPSSSRAATFTATFDRDTISLGETATLSLTFEGGAPAGPPPMPSLPDLDLNYLSQSSQFSVGNGQTTSTRTYTYSIRPRKAGEFTIPALRAKVEGTLLASNPLKLSVAKPNAPPPDAAKAATQNAFLKLVLPRKGLYLGETVVGEVQLFVSERILGVTGFQWGSLAADGLNLGTPQQDKAYSRRAQVGQATFKVFRFLLTVRPVKTGTFTLGPVTATVMLQVPSRNRPRDPFEAFGLFGPAGEQQQLPIATEAETIQSLALPSQGVPPSFNGAVGEYEMTVTAGPTTVTAGDPVTVRVRISGRGALDALSLPEQPAWRDFKTFPPTANVEADPSNPFGLAGAKTFEQVVMPQNSEIKELPALAFSFFDPVKKQYRTLTQPAIPLTVHPGASVAAPPLEAAPRGVADAPKAGQDIVHIKPRPGVLAEAAAPLALRPWFLLWQALPVAAWAGLLVWRRRTDALANNPRRRRQREVAKIVSAGLADLRQGAQANDSDAFFASLVRLLQEQLGERLDLPASAITEAVVEERLVPRGVPTQVTEPLAELFQACNLARYAPVRTSQELAAFIPRLEAVLRDLQSLRL